jgi:hypothetical protein
MSSVDDMRENQLICSRKRVNNTLLLISANTIYFGFALSVKLAHNDYSNEKKHHGADFENRN